MKLLSLLQNINQRKPSISFDRIAQYLFQSCVIQVQNSHYQLTEIEFYYYEARWHPDVYAHKNEVQLDLGNWYFHGSGLDITFGNRTKQIYGGILIRGIKSIETGAYTSGPINTVRELMRNFQQVTVSASLQLKENEAFPIRDILKTARIGLNPARDLKFNTNYCKAYYRYLIDWETDISGHRFKDKLNARKQGILCTFVLD